MAIRGNPQRIFCEGVRWGDLDTASIKYGFTWAINKDFSCDVSASQGLTTDSPSFILEVRFPYKF